VPLDTSVPFASKVDAILTGTGYSDQRAAQMDITDLLELLSAFHDALIHFS
jgi:18S rRNA (adenine1779-N6/adenine1780-N6)-dimethyltransferase